MKEAAAVQAPAAATGKKFFLSNHGCALWLSFFNLPDDKYYNDDIQYLFNRMYPGIVAALFLVTLSGKRLNNNCKGRRHGRK